MSEDFLSQYRRDITGEGRAIALPNIRRRLHEMSVQTHELLRHRGRWRWSYHHLVGRLRAINEMKELVGLLAEADAILDARPASPAPAASAGDAKRLIAALNRFDIRLAQKDVFPREDDRWIVVNVDTNECLSKHNDSVPAMISRFQIAMDYARNGRNA